MRAHEPTDHIPADYVRDKNWTNNFYLGNCSIPSWLRPARTFLDFLFSLDGDEATATQNMTLGETTTSKIVVVFRNRKTIGTFHTIRLRQVQQKQFFIGIYRTKVLIWRADRSSHRAYAQRPAKEREKHSVWFFLCGQ